jgi:phosphatidylserine decarboxylase
MDIFSSGKLVLFFIITSSSLTFAYFFWRYFWFFRNPPRNIPKGENIVSPADGTVVYVERVPPNEPIISVKNQRHINVADIVRKDFHEKKIVIGIFMSPFDVHYNRAPVSGQVELVRHYPARLKNHHMTSMHWRSLLKRFPLYENSPHIVDNERTITRISGHFKTEPIACYVVQIAGGSVNGIDSYIQESEHVEKGTIFGRIRIGSQVDVVITCSDSMHVRVRPGEKVRAGETIIVE